MFWLDVWKARSIAKYIFFELLPSFFLGLVIFVLILLMFQTLRLTEFVLVHGVSPQVIFSIMGYLTLSFLPIVLPMSLLFSVLLTYGRLAADSEIIALKAQGLQVLQIGLPAFCLGAIVMLVSAQTSFQLAPWGNRQFELIVNELQRSKTTTTIRAGVFSEGFFDLVVYANEVNPDTGVLRNVFIYDERQADTPLTIIAAQGELLLDSRHSRANQILRLREGDIHRTTSNAYTKISFESYDINLVDEVAAAERRKSALSYTYEDLRQSLRDPELPDRMRLSLRVEFHRRFALAAMCLIFAVIGVALGASGHRRSGKGNGLTLSLVLCVVYWLSYVAAEGLAKAGTIPVPLALWSVNLAFLGFGLWTLRTVR